MISITMLNKNVNCFRDFKNMGDKERDARYDIELGLDIENDDDNKRG